MAFMIKVNGQTLVGLFSSAAAAYESTAEQFPEARSIGVFCLRWNVAAAE